MGRNFSPPFSERQLKAVAIAPKIAAFPSILGSLFIIQHVLLSKKRRGRVYHRILLLMSINDFIYSVKAFVSTWPIPEDTLFVHGARGTTQTCTVTGFFGQGGSLTSIVYNGSLTLFFLLVVRYGWKEEYIKENVEPWLHAVPFAVGWSTAIAGLPLSLYNAFGWTCWINSYPFGCIDNVNCERGDYAGIYRWAFFHAELWAIYAFTLVAMFMIYLTIAKQEKALKKYAFRESVTAFGESTNRSIEGHSSRRLRDEHRKRSTNFAVQATFYMVVFFFTWFFPMLQTVFGVSRDELYYPLILLSSILSSMQGFFNAVIYLRPRWIRSRKQKPQLSRWQIFAYAILGDPDGGGISSSCVALRRKLKWFEKSPGALTSGSMASPAEEGEIEVMESKEDPESDAASNREEAAPGIEDAIGDEYLD